MAETTSVNVQFAADTSGFKSGVEQVQQDMARLFSDINALSSGTQTVARRSAESTGEMFKTLQSAVDSAIPGMMKGTESWQQAMAKTAQSMEIKFAQLSANIALNFAKDQMNSLVNFMATGNAMVAANDDKNVAISSGDQRTAKAGSAARTAQVIKQIESDAAATYAGVYAYLSPVLGPAAAVPAGISAAAVAGMEGLVSLDVGAWNLGSDMVAQLHQGEMVVPQAFAQGLREGGGIGGDNYTININAIDTQTGAQFLKNNASAIASAISSQVRSFNNHVPAWKS